MGWRVKPNIFVVSSDGMHAVASLIQSIADVKNEQAMGMTTVEQAEDFSIARDDAIDAMLPFDEAAWIREHPANTGDIPLIEQEVRLEGCLAVIARSLKLPLDSLLKNGLENAIAMKELAAKRDKDAERAAARAAAEEAARVEAEQRASQVAFAQQRAAALREAAEAEQERARNVREVASATAIAAAEKRREAAALQASAGGSTAGSLNVSAKLSSSPSAAVVARATVNAALSSISFTDYIAVLVVGIAYLAAIVIAWVNGHRLNDIPSWQK